MRGKKGNAALSSEVDQEGVLVMVASAWIVGDGDGWMFHGRGGKIVLC